MQDIIEQIKKYQAAAEQIEPSAEQRKDLLGQVNDYVEGFLESVHSRKAYIQDGLDGAGLLDSGIEEGGMELGEVLGLYRDNVEQQGITTVSGKFMGYIAPCSMYYSALADYIAAVTDPYSADYSASPGAVQMEHTLIRWMADLLGYPDTTMGNLSSGGSLATFICIVTAREARQIKSRDIEKTVVYVTELTHHCFLKGLHLAGLGECVVRKVALDDGYRMKADALAEIVKKDRESGLVPWLVAASTGTTDVGGVDPLNDIANVAEENNLWFHIDGAYGGFFILSELVKEKFKGVERSDSIVMNPHKTLYTPFGLGAALIREGRQLRRAHYHTADYLQDNIEDEESTLSPADFGPELSRHFRALRLWLPLKLIGVAPFRAALSEKILLTRYTYERMAELDNFEMGPYPDLSTFAFRYLPDTGDADDFNRQLVLSLRADGRIFLSSTMLGGKFMIRVNILSYRTHLETMDYSIEVILENIKALLEKGK